MTPLERAAKELFRLMNVAEGEVWSSKHIMEDVREDYRNAARAALEAFVDGLSNNQLHTICTRGVRHVTSFGAVSFNVPKVRAALKAAMEVSDEPNV